MNSEEQLLNSACKDKWRRIGVNKRAGVVVPLFSVYSQKSIGIGDLDDLRLLIDWAKETGNSVIQLLPLNEVGSTFCPYDSISSFALEPIYISLEKITKKHKNTFEAKIEKLREEFLRGKTYLDYRIKKAKLQLLWDMFIAEGQDVSDELRKFIEDNIYWLQDFALFKVIKEYQSGKAWDEWEDKYKYRDPAVLENFKKKHEREITFQMWVQWQLYKQFKEVKKYAKSKKIFIKGDLPILVSRDSADVWRHPDFFKLEYASGAPPDMYAAKGQRWGMPTYNWEKISADGYRYLKEKLKYAQGFYDILRIDHVVGLFRIWSIPYHEPLKNQGLHGFFDPKEESKWQEHGKKILSVMLDNTKMLLCAEDLGIIPAVCPNTLKELGIPGNDVQRWVKDWKVKHDFLKPQDYRIISVAMLSTHDTTNWPAWWENEAGTVDEALFTRKCNERGIDYNKIKNRLFDINLSRYGRLRWLNSIDSADKLVSILNEGLSPTTEGSPCGKGTVPKEHLADFIDMYENTYQEKEKLWKHLNLKGPMREKSDSEIVRQVLKISLESSAIFCINTLIDYLYLTGLFKGDPYQYRINTPGTISQKNWSLTIPISLEELLKHKVNKEIRAMISSAGIKDNGVR